MKRRFYLKRGPGWNAAARGGVAGEIGGEISLQKPVAPVQAGKEVARPPGSGRLAVPEDRELELLEHVGAHAVRAEDNVPVGGQKAVVADRVVHVGTSIVREEHITLVHGLDLGRGEPESVADDSPGSEGSEPVQPVHEVAAVAVAGIDGVVPVLGEVDVDAPARGLYQVGEGLETFVAEGESRVSPDRRVDEGAPPLGAPRGAQGVDLGGEASVLADSRPGSFGSVAVRRFVAEQAPDSGFFAGLPDHGKAAIYGVGAGMVVDEGGNPGGQGVGAARKSAGHEDRQVYGPVQSPPEVLEYLGEVLGGLDGHFKAPGQGRIEVCVSADETGRQVSA